MLAREVEGQPAAASATVDEEDSAKTITASEDAGGKAGTSRDN